jgi:hypothetical protein
MATAKRAAKKTTAKKSTGGGQACWPGFKRVPGTKAGTKGSCEQKADSRAAAASKREKAA